MAKIMFLAGEQAQAFHSGGAQSVHVQHSFYRQLYHAGRIFFDLSFKRGFFAAFGITGLETAFAVCNEALVEGGHITLNRLIELMTSAPAKLLGLKSGALSEGYAADFVLLDPQKSFVFDKTYSRSSNTPWLGKTLKGKVEATYVGGARAYPF